MIIKEEDFSHIEGIQTDRMTTFLLDDEHIRGAILNGTKMVNLMQANHELGLMESLILGHAYLGVGLLVSDMKGQERIVIQFDTVGPIRGLTVESNSLGDVRGYLKNSELEIKSEPESLDTAPYIGQGFLLFSRYLAEETTPFTGQIVLQHSTIAKDLAHYFYTSEQRPTSFNLSVKFNSSAKIMGAGGIFLQVLPGAHEEALEKITKVVENLPSLGSLFANKMTTEDIVLENFKDFSPNILASRYIGFNCRCSKERFGSFIGAMEKKDIIDILEKGPFPLETTCHNCNSVYSFSRDEIIKLTEQKMK